MFVIWSDTRCYINGVLSFTKDTKLYADSELSETSENSVQNKVVTEKLAELDATKLDGEKVGTTEPTEDFEISAEIEAKLTELSEEINGNGEVLFSDSIEWTNAASNPLKTTIECGDISEKNVRILVTFDNAPTNNISIYFASGKWSSDIIETKTLAIGVATEFIAPLGTTHIWIYSGTSSSSTIQGRADVVIPPTIAGLKNEVAEIVETVKYLNKIHVVRSVDSIKVIRRNSKKEIEEVKIAPFGANNIWQIRSVTFYAEDGTLLKANETTTDSVGPYQVKAVNNADGENIGTAVANFTGGTHGYNGDTTGSATASSIVEIFSDADMKDEFGCSYLDIVVTNKIQGWNTRKADGSGREILKEEVHYIFSSAEDGIIIKNNIEALEDIVINLYYGMQIAFARDKVRFYAGEKSSWLPSSDNASYVGDCLDCVAAKSDNLEQRMWVEPKGLGHFTYVPDTIAKAFQSGKVYYNLIREDLPLAKGEGVFFTGGYSFAYAAKSIVMSGSYDISNAIIDINIPRGDLQSKEYGMKVSYEGSQLPPNVNVYLAKDKWSSGIITTYTKVLNGDTITIAVTDEVNLVRIYANTTSTCKVSYEIFDL
jgi:hypothetical protein